MALMATPGKATDDVEYKWMNYRGIKEKKKKKKDFSRKAGVGGDIHVGICLARVHS